MKRTPLKPGNKPLLAKTPLKRTGAPLKPSKLLSSKSILLATKRAVKGRSKRPKTAIWYRKQCDILFSKLIRSTGHCVRCGKQENLQCSHIISRAVMSLRCEPLNAIPLCYGCHITWWHKSPLEAAAWFNQKYPGRYELLNCKMLDSIGEKVDWKAKYDLLKAQQ